MTNAGQELREFLAEHGEKLEAAEIEYNQVKYTLWPGYDLSAFQRFIDYLDTIVYDEGYGGQRLFGTLWLSNNTWAERGEYDGSEWWEFRERPPVPRL